MSKLTLELPDSLHRRAAALAALDGLPLEQFVALAVAEKLSAMESVEWLGRQVAGSSREAFERYLAAVPHAEPIETDRIPE